MIQGFFFQGQMLLGIGYGIDGARAVINQAMVRDMFAGVFGEGEFSEEWEGSLVDAFGNSTLSGVELAETQFRFDKSYDGRDDKIHYEFRRDGAIWVGEYSGDYVGKGGASCIITPIPRRMFLNIQS